MLFVTIEKEPEYRRDGREKNADAETSSCR